MKIMKKIIGLAILKKRKQFSKTTAKKICSVRRTFYAWIEEKNKRLRLSLKKVPTHSLEQWSVEDINYWLPVFLNEARNEKKELYKAKTLMEYLLMLQSHCHAHNVMHYFLRDEKFSPVRNSLENVMKMKKRRAWV